MFKLSDITAPEIPWFLLKNAGGPDKKEAALWKTAFKKGVMAGANHAMDVWENTQNES